MFVLGSIRHIANRQGYGTTKSIGALSIVQPSDQFSRYFSTKKSKSNKYTRNRRGIDWDRQRKPFKLCLLGRPNVGKSTIFNSLVKKNSAIVSKIPGTTRDRREGEAQLGELEFKVIDTGGLEEEQGPTSSFDSENTGLLASMMAQVEFAMDESDVGLFVVDSKEGITRDDEYFSRWLRSRQHSGGKKLPIHLISNKAENCGDAFEWGSNDQYWENFLIDCYKLGFGDPIPMSAEHGQGLSDLYTILEPYGLYTMDQVKEKEEKEKELEIAGGKRPINIAIVGRTNVGKSSLINQLIGTKRVISGPLAGLTRDAISIEWEYEDQPIQLIDTAGMRKKTKLYMDAKRGKIGKTSDGLPGKVEQVLLEGLSIDKSLNALGMAQVVLMVLDLEKKVDSKGRERIAVNQHDLSIMGRIMEEGRAMVIIANKCDLIIPESFKEVNVAGNFIANEIEDQIENSVPLARGAKVIPISALTGFGINEIMPAVLETYEKWNTKISTSRLNRFIQQVQEKQTAPSKPMNIRSNRIGKELKPKMAPVKIKFMNQMHTRPPHFALFINRIRGDDALPQSYISYLTNQVRNQFGLEGIPVRFSVKKSKNKFSGKGAR